MRREEDILNRMRSCARRAYWLRLTPASSGNISVRTGGSGGADMIISASGTCMGCLGSNDLLPYPSKGRKNGASSETPLHLALYGVRSDAGAVLHYHGCWTVLAGEAGRSGKWVPSIILPEFAEFAVGEGICIVRKLPPGSDELADEAAAAAKCNPAHGLILRGHGGVVWGETPEEALFAAEALEETARLDYLYRGREWLFSGKEE